MCLPKMGTSWIELYVEAFERPYNGSGTYEDEKSFQNVKKLPGTGLVAGFDTLPDDLDHARKECLERALYGGEQRRYHRWPLRTYNFIFVIGVKVLSDKAKGSARKLRDPEKIYIYRLT